MNMLNNYQQSLRNLMLLHHKSFCNITSSLKYFISKTIKDNNFKKTKNLIKKKKKIDAFRVLITHP
jgi:hypothetical protein